MLIIIEGVDNTGKTTLAQHLQEVFTLDYMRVSVPKTDNPFQERLAYFSEIRTPSVMDRAHLSEYVYGKLWKDRKLITEKQFELLDLELMSHFEYTVIIHAQASDQIIRERCIKNKEDLLALDQIAECSALFHEAVKKTQIPVLNYYSDLETVEDMVDQLCQMGLSIG